MRISIIAMCIGVVIQVVPNTYGVLITGRLISSVERAIDCLYWETDGLLADSASDVYIYPPYFTLLNVARQSCEEVLWERWFSSAINLGP